MSAAQVENARMLAHALALDAESAARLLDQSVLITAEPESASLAQRVALLLARSVRSVSRALVEDASIEIVIWPARARTTAAQVLVVVEETRSTVGALASPPPADTERATVHGVFEILVACYACAAVVRILAGTSFSLPYRDPVVVDFGALLTRDERFPSGVVELGVLHLAGAGAIGTHFLNALSTFDVRGELHLIDPDVVSDGNLNRCEFFEETDVGQAKVDCLARRAASMLPGVRLYPHPKRLQELREPGAWLKQLVLAVDSRRARRGLQEEVPRDVFDASTSGIEEVVLHFNSHAAPGACVSCIYHEDPAEDAHEAHIADKLGVPVTELRDGFVTPIAEHAIQARHPSLVGRSLVGLAYDSLFKELCGAGALGRDDGQQVLAPLAFVSALAGALLAFELVRRRARGTVVEPFNLWRVSPWAPPLVTGWRMLSPRAGCTYCSRPHFADTAKLLWGGEKWVAGTK